MAHDKNAQSDLAYDSMTTNHIDRTLTLAHYQQQLQNQKPPQGQSTSQTANGSNSSNQTNGK